MEKAELLAGISNDLAHKGFTIERKDMDRPWGGFFVIDETQAAQFVSTYFAGSRFGALVGSRKVSPKILVVAPEKRLSWQYHYRRSEVWRVVEGKVGIVRSETDEQTEVVTLEVGDQVVLPQGMRHRLVGLDDFAVIAEIWQHTDPEHPSDENDIVRLDDDFGRKEK